MAVQSHTDTDGFLQGAGLCEAPYQLQVHVPGGSEHLETCSFCSQSNTADVPLNAAYDLTAHSDINAECRVWTSLKKTLDAQNKVASISLQ